MPSRASIGGFVIRFADASLRDLADLGLCVGGPGLEAKKWRLALALVALSAKADKAGGVSALPWQEYI